MNLPANLKMTPPRYQDCQASQIPVVIVDPVKMEKIDVVSGDQTIDKDHYITIKVMAGESFGVQGAGRERCIISLFLS